MGEEEFNSVTVRLVLEFSSNSGVPSLKDIAEMVTPYGDLLSVEQISTSNWGRT